MRSVRKSGRPIRRLMEFGKQFFYRLGLIRSRRLQQKNGRHRWALRSRRLGREVIVDVYVPPAPAAGRAEGPPLLLVHDGQDLPGMRFGEILAQQYAHGRLPGLLVAAIHAGDRLREFGMAGQPDYLGRGDRAGAYQRFVRRRLLPWLRRRYQPGPAPYAVAGFSLGALTAFDLGWNHPGLFDRVGLFSGALWWRSEAFRPDDPDADRIVHDMVDATTGRPPLQAWLQTGTEDETADRNGNGIIDAIDDTLDLIRALERNGLRLGRELRYLEIKGGRHHPDTWAKAFPDFLHWAFARTGNS